MKTYSVFEIADWFLTKSSMTPKKLQKLTYYSEAWSQALMKQSLMSDTAFEAWAHGPVSPELWQEYHPYGWTEIPKKKESIIEDPQAKDLLESVWVTYGKKSANELEALTHQELPWKNARIGLDDGMPSNTKISPKDMANYYLSIYNGD